MTDTADTDRQLAPQQLLNETIRRVQWGSRGSGAQARPRVGIISSQSDMAVCFSHLPEVARIVADEVGEGGGLGLVLPTAAPCDSLYFANGQAARLASSFDRMVADIESAVRAVDLDALVLLASCDTTVPAHLIAAARIDVPTVILPCGYQLPGALEGRRTDLIDVYESVGAALTGRISQAHLGQMADACSSGPGVCPGVGTAMTMHIACEALGITPLGHSPISGASPRLREQARLAAHAAREAWRRGLNAGQVLTTEAVTDAVALVLAIGGASSSFGFLQRLADELQLRDEAGQAFDVRATAERVGSRVSQQCFVAPCGPMPVEAFEQAGGAAQVLKRLEPLLHLERPVVSGDTLRSALATVEPKASPVFELPADARREPGLLVMRGNLAPGGGLLRPAATGTPRRSFRGKALVLENSTAAYEALADGRLVPGTVIVIRRAGLDDFGCALHGAGLSGEVAMVTDGGHSGICRGLAVSFVRPSAADGGPIGKVADGDLIEIDADARSVNLLSG
jgi:dihydroxy-acid dehydratase